MCVLVLLLGILTATLGVYLALKSSYGYWKKRGVPHPPVSILFGNVTDSLTFKKSIGQIYTEIYSNFPSLSYVGFYKMRQPGIVLRDPELIKDVLIKNFSSFHDNDIHVNEDVDPLIIRNPFFIRGEKWKTARSQLTPSFTTKQIKPMFSLMEAVSKKLNGYLKETNSICVDAKDLSGKYTTDVVASCVFGLEANSFLDPDAEFRRMGQKLLSQSFFTTIKQVIQFVVPSLAKIVKAQFITDDTANYFRKIVADTLEYRKTHNIVRNDFLDTMLEYKSKLGEDVFTNEDVTAHAVGFLIDGFETSSIVLSFALYELGANPEVQRKLKEEVDTVLQNSTGKLTYDAVQEMVYLDKVVNESLRKHPPALFVGKVCTNLFTLPSPDGNGSEVTIEPDTSVVVPVYGLHYDPKYYPDPDRFDPERFSEANSKDRLKGTYLPFGEGPRMCLGQRFGTAQVKVGLASLVSQFEIRVNRKTITPLQVDPTYFLLAAKGGIWLDFHARGNL